MDIILINTLRRRKMKITRRLLRDSSDPYNSTTDKEFIRLFRFPKYICRIFVAKIAPFLTEGTTYHSISANLRILSVLRFLATGSYQRPIAQDYYAAMSQTSVSRSLQQVCSAIVDNLAAQVLKFPVNDEERNAIKEKFYEKFGFPGVIGLIDGTLILMKKPQNNIEQVYYSVRKSAHAKNVSLVCDFDHKIIGINARYGGSAHDSYVWNNSNLKNFLEHEYSSGKRDSWLLGDSRYGVQPWLMTPFIQCSSTAEEKYNKAHKKARSSVERSIGILKSCFRCLCRQRILMYSPAKAGLIINACSVLHNLLIDHGFPLDESEIEIFMDPPDDDLMSGVEELDVGRRVR